MKNCEGKSSSLVNGVWKLTLPVQYLQEHRSEQDEKIFNKFADILKEISEGSRSGIILPAVRDEKGNRLFDIEYVGPNK